MDYDLVKGMPDDRLGEKPLCVFWDSMAMAEAMGEDTTGLVEGKSLTVIDGNHRIMKRFLEGDEGQITIQVVTEPQDMARFTYRNDKRLIDQF